MKKLIRLLFGFQEPVTRMPYIVVGTSLMVIKFLVEFFAHSHFHGFTLTPLMFLNPFLSRCELVSCKANYFLFDWVAWNIPFIWIGLSMSMRRSENAGKSPWWGTLFFVPGVNLLLMAVLSILPTSPVEGRSESGDSIWFSGPFWAIVVSSTVAFLSLIYSVNTMGDYGAGLFLGAPFVAGLLGSYLLNRKKTLSPKQTYAAAIIGQLCIMAIFLLTAREGLYCLAMALPLSLIISIPAAFIGRELAIKNRSHLASVLPVFLVMPAFAAYDFLNKDRYTYEVLSSVDIQASPETVWKNVVSFPDLPAPSEWYFKGGIAYPLRARIEGRGVGAIRRCQFSTGDFVEPITAWEEPTRLAFDVKENPQPMTELNPFWKVDAPHLHGGYMESERGEFRLLPLPGGGTRLEGRTWYHHGLYPQAYWRLFSDEIIHRIHLRVLNHIKAISETQG